MSKSQLTQLALLHYRLEGCHVKGRGWKGVGRRTRRSSKTGDNVNLQSTSKRQLSSHCEAHHRLHSAVRPREVCFVLLNHRIDVAVGGGEDCGLDHPLRPTADLGKQAVDLVARQARLLRRAVAIDLAVVIAADSGRVNGAVDNNHLGRVVERSAVIRLDGVAHGIAREEPVAIQRRHTANRIDANLNEQLALVRVRLALGDKGRRDEEAKRRAHRLEGPEERPRICRVFRGVERLGANGRRR
mmetsp:Transcript_15054/g.44724  ORF Transcript_15054/g.44724 Transcript_15054/m.44724 type:complete len:243 (-) Transcript_15054:1219-1947(-)